MNESNLLAVADNWPKKGQQGCLTRPAASAIHKQEAGRRKDLKKGVMTAHLPIPKTKAFFFLAPLSEREGTDVGA